MNFQAQYILLSQSARKETKNTTDNNSSIYLSIVSNQFDSPVKVVSTLTVYFPSHHRLNIIANCYSHFTNLIKLKNYIISLVFIAATTTTCNSIASNITIIYVRNEYITMIQCQSRTMLDVSPQFLNFVPKEL